MLDDEREFLDRVKIGKGQANLEKQKLALEAKDGLYLPKGLKRRDQARLGLKLVEPVYEQQIKLKKVQEKIKGCTDYESVMWFHLNNHTRKYIFTKLRTRKNSNTKEWVPTKVSLDWLIALALNLGGDAWTQH